MAFYNLVKATIQPDGSTKADPVLASPEQKRSNWKALVEITDRFNDPGKFTTLPGFEWSSQPKYSNLHRNVIFRSSEEPARDAVLLLRLAVPRGSVGLDGCAAREAARSCSRSPTTAT